VNEGVGEKRRGGTLEGKKERGEGEKGGKERKKEEEKNNSNGHFLFWVLL